MTLTPEQGDKTWVMSREQQSAYLLGYKDARHAAAELVAGLEAELEAERDLLHSALDKAGVPGCDNLPLRLEELLARLETRLDVLVREAFRAGYHAQWIKADGRCYWIFDPALKPGDPDGALFAWAQQYPELRGRFE